MKQIIDSFLDLLYPKTCIACNQLLTKSEIHICLHCSNKLNLGSYNYQIQNLIHLRLSGKVNIKFAYAPFIFTKNSIVQNMIHAIKYEGKRKEAFWLGGIVGQSICDELSKLPNPLLIPVPLHRLKLMKRGYNQSLLFAQGIAKTTQIELLDHILVRNEIKSSQTNFKRLDRWKNTEFVYELSGSDSLANKDIVLIDDVITSGATIESCAFAFNQHQINSFSVVSMSLAE
jgi:ComF family protein